MASRTKLRELAKRVARSLVGKSDLRSYLRSRRIALQKRWYRAPVTLDDLRQVFSEVGVKRGQSVWLQSAWNEFYNYKGTPSSVIDLLLEMIGPDATLVMLATPIHIDTSKVLFIDREPVSTGMICEIFRRYKGVKRSIHLSASVIALGPHAEYLTRDHHETLTPWDDDSPCCRLMDIDALCVSVGNWRFLASLSPLHVVEAKLRTEIEYFSRLFTKRITYEWQAGGGRRGSHTFLARNGEFDSEKFGRLYPRSMSKRVQLSNLQVWSITARDAIETGVKLGRSGKTMYVSPKPDTSLFRPVVPANSRLT